MRGKRGTTGPSSSERQVASGRDDQGHQALLHHTCLPSSQAAGRNKQTFLLSAPARKSFRGSPVHPAPSPAGKVTQDSAPSPRVPGLGGGSYRSKALAQGDQGEKMGWRRGAT